MSLPGASQTLITASYLRSVDTALAYASRRVNSIHAAKEILLKAEPRFPKEGIIKYNLACYSCQTGDIETAKNYLKKAFEIDSSWRLNDLNDEDLKPMWDSL